MSNLAIQLPLYEGPFEPLLALIRRIYGNSDGAPGTLLVGPVTVKNLATNGTCCTLAVANFTPVAVTGGTQYWVVADTPLTGTGSDSEVLWYFVPKSFSNAVNDGSGWFWIDANSELAGKVLGTMP
ncbi:MAG: hypothetical protein ABSD75_33245 [Terriglobales bacterium]|jgi:hypothetical protein